MKTLSTLLPILFLFTFLNCISCQLRINNDTSPMSQDQTSDNKWLFSCLSNQISKLIEEAFQSNGTLLLDFNSLQDLSSVLQKLNQTGTKLNILQILTICLKEGINPTESGQFLSPRDDPSPTSLSYSEEVAKKFEKSYGADATPIIYEQNKTPNIVDEEEENNRDPAPDLVYVVFESIAAHADLPPPTSLRSCLNGKSGRIILNFMLDIIGELHDGGYERVRPTAIAFDNVLPENSKACLSSDPNFEKILNAYEIKATSLPDFYEQVTRVGLSKDFMKLRMTCRRILIAADMEDFEALGENAGKLLNLVFTPNKMSHVF